MATRRTTLGPDLFPIQMDDLFGASSPSLILFSEISTADLQEAFGFVPEKGLHAAEVYAPLGWFGRIQVHHNIIFSSGRIEA
jgi:hypothetical protein